MATGNGNILRYARGLDRVELDLVTGALTTGESESCASQSGQSESLSAKGLTFTIETASNCNFECTYCYQNDKGSRQKLTREVAQAAVEYIVASTTKYGGEAVLVNFIGGEPMLNVDAIVLVGEQLKERLPCPVYAHMDTNGMFHLGRVLAVFENIEINICLSLPEDHTKLRYSAGHDTTQRILRNLSTIELTAGQHIVVGYNVHDGNIGEFGEFLDWLEPYRNNPIEAVTAEYIDNYEFNQSFHNVLSRAEFSAWKGSEFLEQLSRHGWPVTVPRRMRKVHLCQGHQPYSCKIYADGSVTICDAMSARAAKLTIWDLLENVEGVNRAYNSKSVDPMALEGCRSCSHLEFCGGRKWCYDGGCNKYARTEREAAVDWLMGRNGFFQETISVRGGGIS